MKKSLINFAKELQRRLIPLITTPTYGIDVSLILIGNIKAVNYAIDTLRGSFMFMSSYN